MIPERLKLKRGDKSILFYFIDHTRLTMLLSAAIFLFGAFAVAVIPRALNPDVEIGIGIITTPYIGASPEDVENLVTREIEDKIKNIEGIDTYSSTSSTGFSMIQVQFREGQDIPARMQDLRDKVDQAKVNLPDDANDPSVTKISFDSFAILIITLSGPYELEDLGYFADQIKDVIENEPGVENVGETGAPTERLEIAIDPFKLLGYGLTTSDISTALQNNHFNYPIGKLPMAGYQWTIRTQGRFENVEDISELPIATYQGEVIRVKDVATVKSGYADLESYSRFSEAGQNPQNAVTLTITNESGADVIRTVASIEAKIEKLKENFPQDLQISVVQNYADTISDNFGELFTSFVETIIIVFIALMFFIGWKEALFASITVPVSLLIGIIGLYFLGESMNVLSNFALILTLGMLVDNGIVVQGGVHDYMKMGAEAPEAAKLSVRDFKFPVIGGTLTMVAAFVPMLMTPGIIGEFIKVIPLTVTIVLFGSLVAALVVNMAFSALFLGIKDLHLPRSLKILLIILAAIGGLGLVLAAGYSIWAFFVVIALIYLATFLDLSEILDNKFVPVYLNFLRKFFAEELKMPEGHGLAWWIFIFPFWLLRHSGWQFISYVSVLVLFFLAMLLPIFGILPVKMFAGGDYDYFNIDIELAPGQVIESTNAVMKQVESEIEKTPEVKNFISYIGSGAGGGDTSGAMLSGDETHIGSVYVNLQKNAERARTASEIVADLRARTDALRSQAKITYTTEEGGPPTSTPVYIRIYGEDLNQMTELVDFVREEVRKVPFATDISDSVKLSKGQYTLVFDRYKVKKLGLNAMEISSTLRAGVDSINTIEVWKNNKKQDVSIIFKDPNFDLDRVLDMSFQNTTGELIPLREVVDVQLQPEYAKVARYDGQRMFAVSADVTEGHTALEVLSAIEPTLKAHTWPKGYSYEFSGENEDINESFTGMAKSFIIALILIAIILVIQFDSFTQPFIIMFAIPLTIIAIFPGLTLMGLNFTFPAMIGFVALAGIVVNHAIVLIDAANVLHREHGDPVVQSILEASRTRLRPVILTAITTILGVIPIAFSQPVWAPLSWSIAFGLAFATLIDLFYVPMLYVFLSNFWELWIQYGKQRFFHHEPAKVDTHEHGLES